MIFTRCGNQEMEIEAFARYARALGLEFIHEGFDELAPRRQIRRVRRIPEIIGYSRNTLRSGRRSRCLTWENWIDFNNLLNSHLDWFGIVCVIKAHTFVSSKPLIIRDMSGGKSEEDWELFGNAMYGGFWRCTPYRRLYIEESDWMR